MPPNASVPDPRIAFNLGLADTARGELQDATFQHSHKRSRTPTALTCVHAPRSLSGNTFQRPSHPGTGTPSARTYRKSTFIEDPSLVGARRNLRSPTPPRHPNPLSPRTKDPSGGEEPDTDNKSDKGQRQKGQQRGRTRRTNKRERRTPRQNGDEKRATRQRFKQKSHRRPRRTSPEDRRTRTEEAGPRKTGRFERVKDKPTVPEHRDCVGRQQRRRQRQE